MKKFNLILCDEIVVICATVLVSSIMESSYLKKIDANCTNPVNQNLLDAFQTQCDKAHFFKYSGFTWASDGEKRYDCGFLVRQSLLSAVFD
ncbi:MAG: hypothetical protein HKM23_04595 [Nitrosopumilus sp.]|nr:hypothetical protein [Nitrosopumilus sp.]NNL59416.1 hypothetical protein [Nitrosopumilus sp.]